MTATGEMHRILDAIRKRDADGTYRASADHVRDGDASSVDQKARSQ